MRLAIETGLERDDYFECGGLCEVSKMLDAGDYVRFQNVGCGGLCLVFETRYRCFYAKHKKRRRVRILSKFVFVFV